MGLLVRPNRTCNQSVTQTDLHTLVYQQMTIWCRLGYSLTRVITSSICNMREQDQWYGWFDLQFVCDAACKVCDD